MSPNTNPETGIRYGVIAMNSIDPDVANDLWFGPGATDLSHSQAVAEARREFEAEWDSELEEAQIAANETDPNMREEDFESFIERHMMDKMGADDQDSYVERKLEQIEFQIEEPTIEGTYQGVIYRISWLGGAPLLWVIQGPVGFARRLCSPCVPNAADLDSGFVQEEDADENDGIEHHCYVIPRDWLAQVE